MIVVSLVELVVEVVEVEDRSGYTVGQVVDFPLFAWNLEQANAMDYCDSHSSNLGFLGGPSFVEEVVVSSRTLSDEYIVSEIVLSGHRIYNGIEGTLRTD